MIRTLVVDPSARSRLRIAEILVEDPSIEVVGVTGDRAVAVRRTLRLQPEVVTMDLHMGIDDDVSLLRQLMAECPRPVVMVGSGDPGCSHALAALEAGAQCVVRRSDEADGGGAFAEELRARVKTAAQARVSRRIVSPKSPTPLRVARAPSIEVIALGMSTGGAAALGRILPMFPADSPPIVIVDHMPAGFTLEMASRLDGLCAVRVAEARHGQRLTPGHAWVAPGGDQHLRVVRDKSGLRLALVPARGGEAHVPSVDELFHSVARAAGARTGAALMTGMGRDGAEGLLAVREAGGLTLAQDERSCVVYGMPRAAVRLGAVCEELGLIRIPDRLVRGWAP